MQVLDKDEMKNVDVVDIFDFYETTVKNVFPDDYGESVQVGGDQLTRERFSRALSARAGLNGSYIV